MENKDPESRRQKQSPQEPVQGVVNTLQRLSGTSKYFQQETTTEGQRFTAQRNEQVMLPFPKQSQRVEGQLQMRVGKIKLGKSE